MILAEEAAWPSPDRELAAVTVKRILAEEAAWPSPEAELATSKLSDFLTARYGSLADAKATLGDVPVIRQAFVDVQRALYRQ